MNLHIEYIAFQKYLEPAIRAILLLMLGYITARIIAISIVKTAAEHISAQQAMLLKRIIFYIILIVFAATAISELGFHIGALLGAAGILTVAIGVASQTSVSNIISGLFMIGEKPFEVGHTIIVGNIKGEVLSIDFLSVKIRTADNMLARIPNETLIKSPILNLSFFPICRADLKICITYKENIQHVKTILFDVATKNPLCLTEPKPLLLVKDLGDSGIDLQFSIWSSKNNLETLKSNIQAEIKQAFEDKNIEMPFPSRSLYLGQGSDPLSIKIIN